MPGVLFDSTETEGSDQRKKNTFWKFALGVFVLVFLGILIALQVDKWSEEARESITQLISNIEQELGQEPGDSKL